MSLSREALLYVSRSRRLAALLRRRRFVGRAVRRFMPGEELGDALEAARRFAGARIGTVLTQLGENVTSFAEAEQVRLHYLDVLRDIRQVGLPTEISVKPTQLGLDVDPGACERALHSLVARAAESGSTVWIDMEDTRYTDATLDLFRKVRASRANVGVCLQAYLRRTPADLAALLPLQPAIRLVKGAYAEPPHAAFPRKRDVDAAYFSLAADLLERAALGAARPVFGTHDMALVARIRAKAAEVGAARGACEFHLLYGIREQDQRVLAAEGETVRVLISYGSAWFAWYMRRLAERPANVWFVVKNLL